MKDFDEAGLEDLDWAIGLNRFSLRLMGVWPDSENKKSQIFNDVLRIPFMISAMFWFIVIPQIYALTLVSSDLLLVIDNFMTSWPAFTSCLKLLFLWRVLRPVVNSLVDDWLYNKQSWEHDAMRKKAFIAKLFTIGGYIFIAVSYMGFIVAPLFGLNVRLITNVTDYGKHHLLVQSYYPYDYSKSPNYELTHMSQVLAGTFIAMSLAIPDNYFGILVFHLSAQFEILGHKIEQFADYDEKVSNTMKSNVFKKYLKIMVNRHVHLIRMVSTVENSFALLILTQLLCLYGMACCLGFRILCTFDSDSDKIPIFQIINLAAALVSLLLFTLADYSASETLATYSNGIFNCIYNSKWYVLPKQNSRNLILMMAMSKNPQKLTAGKIVYLSMSSYCGILKSIAGYLSVLIAANS